MTYEYANMRTEQKGTNGIKTILVRSFRGWINPCPIAEFSLSAKIKVYVQQWIFAISARFRVFCFVELTYFSHLIIGDYEFVRLCTVHNFTCA